MKSLELRNDEIEVLFAYWAKEYYGQYLWANEYGQGLDFHAVVRADERLAILEPLITSERVQLILLEVRNGFKDPMSLLHHELV
jgi:hypothetical protein